MHSMHNACTTHMQTEMVGIDGLDAGHSRADARAVEPFASGGAPTLASSQWQLDRKLGS